MHISPASTIRIVLIEEVVFAVVIYHSIRVIHPTIFGSEVIVRAIRLIIVQIKSI